MAPQCQPRGIPHALRLPHQSGCRWLWLLRDSWSAWHTRGIRKLDGWPTGVWKPREGISPLALVYVSGFLKCPNKFLFLDPKHRVARHQCSWPGVFPQPARGQASPLLSHTRTQFLLSLLSSNKSVLPSRPTLTCLFFYFLYLDIKTQHFSPVIGAASALKCSTRKMS